MSNTRSANTVPRPRRSTSVEALAAKRRCRPSGATGHPVVIYRMMHDLTPVDRVEVLRNLQRLTAAEAHPRRPGTAQRWVVRFLALCCFALIPWTIGLALSLPRSYLVGNWPLAWTGFDVILLGCLATTAWSLWKQRQVAVPAAMITSVLLLCDAWFDILTAHGGRCLVISIATAVFGEVPIALWLGAISVRLIHAGVRVARGVEPDSAAQPLWRTPLLTTAELDDPVPHLQPEEEGAVAVAPTSGAERARGCGSALGLGAGVAARPGGGLITSAIPRKGKVPTMMRKNGIDGSEGASGIEAVHGRPSPTYRQGRICTASGCGTHLSRYNPSSQCSIHHELH